MKDAFGVEKSFSSAIKGADKFKPLIEMSAEERAGIKGFHAKAKGVTPEDEAVRSSVQEGDWDKVKRTVYGMERGAKTAPKNSYSKKRVGHRDIWSFHKEAPKSETEAWSVNLPPKPGQSQRQASALIANKGKAGSRSNNAQIAHEWRHVIRRKPASAYVRLRKNPRKLLGDEGRADASDPKYSSEWSTYYAAFMDGDKKALRSMKPDKTYAEGIKQGGAKDYQNAFIRSVKARKKS